MIFIERPDPPTFFLESNLRKYEHQQARSWFSEPLSQRAGKRFVFRSAGEIAGFMERLGEVFNHKCAYCEIKCEKVSDDSLSFFRPREEALQFDGTSSLDHYWWLSWEWSNQYFACARCIRAKDRKFPTILKRAQPEMLGAELDSEQPVLLDPCSEVPSRHLFFEETGKISPKNGSTRGAATIEILDLNRKDLLSARRKHSQNLKDLLKNSLRATERNQGELTLTTRSQIQELALFCESDQMFAEMSRQLLRGWIRKVQLNATLELPTPSLENTHWQSLISQLETYESGPAGRAEPEAAHPQGTIRHTAARYRAIDQRNEQVIKEVQRTMPQVDPDHLRDFGLVLGAITNYMGVNLQQALYREGEAVSEADFQKNLLYHLRIWLGEEVCEGPKQGGGPTDIQYKGVTIELKVEKVIGDRRKMIEKYLSQTTHYSSAGGAQLGILCVLDLTKKVRPPANPQNQITLEMPQVHGFNATPKFPTRIAVVVIDGNLRLPSSYSHY